MICMDPFYGVHVICVMLSKSNDINSEPKEKKIMISLGFEPKTFWISALESDYMMSANIGTWT